MKKTESNEIYIQVTCVYPVSRAEKKIGKVTKYQEFYFELPFVKGNSTSLYGAMDLQWIRKTVLTTKFELPNCIERSSVEISKTKELEYEPIRVRYRELKQRTNLTLDLISTKNINNLRPVLQGSLVPTVNDGPIRIAEVFLVGEPSKYQTKLKRAFYNFLAANFKSLCLLREAVSEGDPYSELYDALHKGYFQLKSVLQKFIEGLEQFQFD